MAKNIGQSFGLQTMSPEMKNAVNYHRWLFKKINSYLGQRVLEIGMGDGTYTEFIRDKELVVGIDIADDCLDFCKKRFVGKNNIKCLSLDLLTGDLSDIKYQKLDSAFCFNVLEHVEKDVDFLKKIKELIVDGGQVAIIVPAMGSLYGKMDALAGHFRRYNKNKMISSAKQAGWQIVKLEYFNFLGGVAWLLFNSVAKPQSLADKNLNKQIILFDKFVLPITKFCDWFTKKWFGQSLLVILKK